MPFPAPLKNLWENSPLNKGNFGGFPGLDGKGIPGGTHRPYGDFFGKTRGFGVF